MSDVETLKKYVGAEHASEVEVLAGSCDKSKLSNLTFKNPRLAQVLAIFVGLIGIDRLYQGGLKMFGCKLAMVILTFGTWWLADMYFTRHTVEEANYQKLLAAAA